MKRPQIPAYALPFVTRALRGGRFRRYASMSALLCALTMLLGMYLAVGSGRFEQEVRVELGHEQSQWEQQHQEFEVILREGHELTQSRKQASLARARRSQGRAHFLAWADEGYDASNYDLGWSQVNGEIFNAFDTLEMAVNSVPSEREHFALRERAAALIQKPIPTLQETIDQDLPRDFGWYSESEVRRLQSILDRDLIPEVSEYSSPLGFSGGIRFIGSFAAMLLSVLLLVLAPLLVAVRQTAEVHENTLQPLTGTSMSPSDLARGLRSGPLAVMAIFALPLAGLLMLSSLFVATPHRAMVFLAVVCAGGFGLSAFAQLLGHVAGARRTPGIVGVSLMLAMGVAWLIGTMLGFDASIHTQAMLGALPQSSAAYVQAWAMDMSLRATPDVGALATIAFGAFAWAAFGVLATRVLAHRIGGLEGPALPRAWAFGGALVAIVLVSLSSTVILDGHVRTEERQLFYFVDLLILALPLGMLLMTRVPIREAPPSLRDLPVLALLGELFAMVAMHMVVAAMFVGPHAFDLLGSPVAIGYLLWAVSVVGLVAIRSAALPVTRVHTHLWFAFCAVCVLVAGAHIVGWTLNNGLSGFEDVLALGQLSPLLGLLQALALLAVPYVCVRSLKVPFRSLSGKVESRT